MRWLVIDTDTLKEARVAALIEACNSAALETNQEGRAAGLIQGVVDEVRRKIASCAANTLDANPTTIPQGLRDLTVDLIIARLKGAIEQPLTEDERNALGRRERDLNRIADCTDTVDQPDNPIDAPMEATHNFPRITPRNLNFDARSQEGV